MRYILLISVIIALISFSSGHCKTPLFNKPLVCKMLGKKKLEQKERLQEIVLKRTKEIKEVEDGFVLFFPYEKDLLIQVFDYAVTENECCPYLKFNLMMEAENDFTLSITGSKEAKRLLEKHLGLD